MPSTYALGACIVLALIGVITVMTSGSPTTFIVGIGFVVLALGGLLALAWSMPERTPDRQPGR